MSAAAFSAISAWNSAAIADHLAASTMAGPLMPVPLSSGSAVPRPVSEEGAHVFITGRRQEALDEAVKAIGREVTAVQGDAADLAALDRLYETVSREKGSIDVLWASAGMGEPGKRESHPWWTRPSP